MIGSSRSIGNTPSRESDEYRRRARRLRGLYGHQPAYLQRKLKELSGSQGVEIRPANPSLMAGSMVAREFAERVEEAIQGGILRYSQRTALIAEAEGAGIKRFEANLIIAVVEHRVREGGEIAGKRGRDARVTVGVEHPSRRWILPATLVVSLQIAIVLLVYFAL